MRPLLLILAPLMLATADEWPQFRGNLQLTGVAVTVLPDNLKLLWAYEAGESIESSAAISAGRKNGSSSAFRVAGSCSSTRKG